jgi:WD40 repeat protein
MANENDQDLTRSSQQKLTKYSSDLIKKGLNLAQIINKNLDQQKYFWASSSFLGEDLEYISSVSISSNGKRLASYHYSYRNGPYTTDQNIIIWDLDSLKKIRTLKGEEPIKISQNGKLLACFQEHLGNKYFVVHDLEKADIFKKINIDDDTFVHSPEISPLLNKIAWLDHNTNNIIIFDLEESQLLHSLPYKNIKENFNPDEGDCFYLTFSPNGDFLAVSSVKSQNFIAKSSDIFIFETQSGKLLKIIDLLAIGGQAPAIVNTDGTNIICLAQGDNEVSWTDYNCSSLLFNIKTGKILSFIGTCKEYYPAISYCSSLDGKTIVQGSLDGIEVLKAFIPKEVLNDKSIKDKVIKDLFYLGDFHFKNKNYTDSKQAYIDIISIDSENEEALYLINLIRKKIQLSLSQFR